MKYIVIIGDGMADYPISELGMLTPLEYANTPNMDFMAENGVMGLVKTVPDGMVPESDTANLALMGYDPAIYSKGRSPLEALSMGIELTPDQTAVRANLVSVSEDAGFEEKILLDHSSDEIPTELSSKLIAYCDSKLSSPGVKLYPGVSYRNLLLLSGAPEYSDFARPHDIVAKKIGPYLPKGQGEFYLNLMKASYEILNNHPINIERAKKGLKKANMLWFWSPGKKPALPLFAETTGLFGSVVCAVDLIKGIGKCAGMDTPFVAGATGGCVTDYRAKAKAALGELDSGKDFVYIHIEAPDECGHKGDLKAKIAAIENIDKHVAGFLMDSLKARSDDFKIMVLPDHPTPISTRTHAAEPVPFVIFSSVKTPSKALPRPNYSEKSAKATGLYIEKGHKLLDFFIKL